MAEDMNDIIRRGFGRVQIQEDVSEDASEKRGEAIGRMDELIEQRREQLDKLIEERDAMLFGEAEEEHRGQDEG